MKIALVSDTHFEFGQRTLPILPDGVDVLVLAGDISTGDYAEMWVKEAIGNQVKHVIYVAGNHEGYGFAINDVHRRLRKLTANNPRLHFLERDTVEIDGIAFIGATAWTNYEVGNAGAPAMNMVHASGGLNDFRRIGWAEEDGLVRLATPEDFLAENVKAKEFIFDELAKRDRKKCVVVTHHGPVRASISPRFLDHYLNCCYVNNWENEVGYHGPALWFHGHVHDEFDYELGDTRIVCHPLAYPGERATPFTWKIIEI